MLKFRSLSYKIALIYILIIVLLMALSSTILYVIFSQILEKQVTDNLSQVMIQTRINLDNLNSNIDKSTMLLYSDSDMASIINKDTMNFSEANYYSKLLYFKLQSLPLSNVLTSYSATLFLSSDLVLTKWVSTADRLYNGVYADSGIMDEKWYKDAVKKDGSAIWFIYRDRNTPYLCAARVLKNIGFLNPLWANNSPNIDVAGTVVLRFDITQIDSQMKGTILTPDTEMTLINTDGTILYSKHADEIGNNINESQNPVREYYKYAGLSKYFIIDGRKYLVNSLKLKCGWKLIATIPYTDIYTRIAIVKPIIFIILILSIIPGAFLSFFISNRILKPVKNLAWIMKSVQKKGNTDISTDYSSNDEVGVLYENFNMMMSQINTLINDVYKSKIHEKDAELRALQAQINPHFLHNTLDSVNWLAMEAGSKKITSIISSLSDMLRYSISNFNEAVSIEDELEQVNKYITIQKICYENSFEAIYNIDDHILKSKCPKLILQPLVENAILHGFSNIEVKGIIEISCTVAENVISLSVSDNGAGADAATLNGYLQGKTNIIKDSKRYGIKNVDARIKLFFDDSYGLRYQSNSYGGITAIISMPVLQ